MNLLVRHSRGVVATSAGRLLFEGAVEILRQVDDLQRAVKALGDDAPETFTLGLPPSIMLQLGADLLLDARDEMPGVFLSLVEELSFVLLEALERGELDAAFAYEVGEHPGLERRAILREELLLVTAPDQGESGEDRISFADAIGRDLVQAGGRDLVRRLVASEAERLALPLHIPFEASSISAMKAIVARGAAASIMPFGIAAQEIRDGLLRSQRIDNPSIRRTLYLVRPARRHTFRAEAALERFYHRLQQRLLGSLGVLACPVESV